LPQDASLIYSILEVHLSLKEGAMKFDPLFFCGPGLEAAQRQNAIAREAYFRAERGFKPGHELEDWLAAEAELNSLVSGGTARLAAANAEVCLPATRDKAA